MSKPDMGNVGVRATLGKVGPNKGGTHGGIDPAGGKLSSPSGVGGFDAGQHVESGNPGTALPWDGADATPKPGQVPPLESL